MAAYTRLVPYVQRNLHGGQKRPNEIGRCDARRIILPTFYFSTFHRNALTELYIHQLHIAEQAAINPL